MPSKKRQFGDIGEKEAENYLTNKGYDIIERNYRIKNLGEIDLVGEKNDKLYFFEVKTRNVKHETDFPIQLSINEKKRKNLRRICELYLIDKNSQNREWQVDGVFINVGYNGEYNIDHLENMLWERYY